MVLKKITVGWYIKTDSWKQLLSFYLTLFEVLQSLHQSFDRDQKVSNCASLGGEKVNVRDDIAGRNIAAFGFTMK